MPTIKSDRAQIIDDIWALKQEYPGMKAAEFSSKIAQACKPIWRNRLGEPNAKWQRVAEDFLRELRRMESFTDLSQPYY